MRKYYVNGVTVSVIAERVQYYDADGKLVTESFKDYTKDPAQRVRLARCVHQTLAAAERKQAIMDELEQAGCCGTYWCQEVGQDLDPFDLICHVVYDQPPLTRREQADNVKKRNYFTKYNETPSRCWNSLLDKYADQGCVRLNQGGAQRSPLYRAGSPAGVARKVLVVPKV